MKSFLFRVPCSASGEIEISVDAETKEEALEILEKKGKNAGHVWSEELYVDDIDSSDAELQAFKNDPSENGFKPV